MDFLADRQQANLLLTELKNLLDFIAVRDATLIHSATAGFGTDDEMLINIVCNRTKDQIHAADIAFRSLSLNKSHKSLRECIKSETSGNYGDFMQYLTQSRGSFLAEQLRKAMDGIGCNKTVVNEIFCTTTSEDINACKEAFQGEYDRNLVDNLKSELGGEHEKLIIHLLLYGRPETPVNVEDAQNQARQLSQMIKNGSTMMGGLKDAAEEQVSKFLADLSPAQCGAVAQAWEQLSLSSDSLEKTIKKKFSGALEEACLQLITEPRDSESKKLHDAMAGIGCDSKTLARILGGAHKHTAVLIAQRYQQKYDRSLREEIRSETGGNFETALLTWLMGADPTNGLEPTLQYYTKLFPNMRNPNEIATFRKLLELAISNVKKFVANLDADLLKIAAKGLGTDESIVIGILCARTKQQLDEIDLIYRAKYNQTLREYIDSELSGDLARMLSYTQMAEEEFDALLLHEAFSGIGCNKDLIVEVVCTRSAARLQKARVYYEAHFDENLNDRIRSELGSGLEKLILRLFAGGRGGAEGPFDPEAVARVLYESGQGRWGSDADGFVDILTNHTQPQLVEVAAAYERLYSSSLEAAIQSEFSGAFEMALISLLYNPVDMFCKFLKKAFDGVGTDEAAVCRILGGNDKNIVHLIANRYFEKYDETLEAALSAELFYDFRQACLTYVKTSDITSGLEQKMKELTIESHNPPPPPVSRKPQPPKPEPKPKSNSHAGRDAAIVGGLVVGFAAAALIAGPAGVVIFGVVAANILLDDSK